jgi:hypothetical protein
MIEVCYDPEHPEQAVLETRAPWTFYFGAAVSGLFVFSGLLVLAKLY